jgi:hypothetical protein
LTLPIQWLHICPPLVELPRVQNKQFINSRN